MIEPVTISDQPPEHPVLDHAGLVAEGIRQLERLSDGRWTDFNAHDPGITILEAACYALTDLGYRIFHDIPDLLAEGGADPAASLFDPSSALMGRAVTPTDLRKVALDVPGVKNAWIEPVSDTGVPLCHDAGTKGLEIAEPPSDPVTAPTVEAVTLAGLHRVSIEKSDQDDIDGSTLRRDVTRLLHAHRNLCEDFHEIHVLKSLPVAVTALVEIAPTAKAEDVLLDIYQRLGAAMSPTLRFLSLTDLLGRGDDPDAVFDGPALVRGQVDMAALEKARRQKALYASDMIREIMAASGVRAVRSVRLSRADSGVVEPWSLAIDDPDATPRFDSNGSSIRLFRGPLELTMDQAAVREAYSESLRGSGQSQGIQSSGNQRENGSTLAAPSGTDRSLATFFPLQDELPDAYGLGTLVPSAPEARKAQAAQLRGYLTFFDQILANDFAQLAHARDLLSFEDQLPEDRIGSYFTQTADTANDGSGSPVHTADFTPGLLQDLVEKPGSPESVQRLQRFADHLLARFGEEISAHPEAATGRVLKIKRDFLRDFLRLSGQRGIGRDSLETDGGVEATLAARVRYKLGLTEESSSRFYLIDHILLRPLAEDAVQGIPFLADAASPDPFSLKLSFILPIGAANAAVVEQVVREETPAHLVPYLLWLDEAAMAIFAAAWEDWTDALMDYWLTCRLGYAASGGGTTATTAFRFRAARDRMIDLLGLGRTFPLRDLPLPDDGLTVNFNTVAQIPVGCSQKDVEYRLHARNGQPVGTAVTGTGETIFLKTPAIKEDVTYVIHARKLGTFGGADKRPGLETDLIETGTVKVGLDATLPAAIKPLPGPDPRIANYGAVIEVEVQRSQDGVDYHLVQFPNGEPTDSSSMAEAEKDDILSENGKPVRGNQGTITLRSKPVGEDTVIHIRAVKLFDPADQRPPLTAILSTSLPLYVRADPARIVTAPAIVGYKANTGIRIEASQASAAYRVWTRRIADEEYRHGAAAGSSTLAGKVVAIPVNGSPDAMVLVPAAPAGSSAPAGFAAEGTGIPGNGGQLQLPLIPPEEDLFIVVEVLKQHDVSDGPPASSSIWLAAVSPMLVKPDDKRQLRLQAEFGNGTTTGTLRVLDGQPGVFYTLKSASTKAVIGPPAYFHKLDATNPLFNKGIGQLKLGVDLVVTVNPSAPARKTLAETPPEPPLLPTDPLAEGTVIAFRAVKAQTGVAVDLAKTVTVTAPAAG